MSSGSCLCGAVRFERTGAPIASSMCHCSKRRRVSGVAAKAPWDEIAGDAPRLAEGLTGARA